MNTWIRTTMAIIAAGSIGLSLTACGSKDKTDEASANLPTAITAELLNGPWVFTESDGSYFEDSDNPARDLRIWAIKDTKIGYFATFGDKNPDGGSITCDYIKDIFTRVKDDQIWKIAPDEPDPNYYTFTYDGELNDTYTTYTLNGDVYDVRLDGEKLTFSLIKTVRSEPVRHATLMRPDQGIAKSVITDICGEVPAWK